MMYWRAFHNEPPGHAWIPKRPMKRAAPVRNPAARPVMIHPSAARPVAESANTKAASFVPHNLPIAFGFGFRSSFDGFSNAVAKMIRFGIAPGPERVDMGAAPRSAVARQKGGCGAAGRCWRGDLTQEPYHFLS